MNEIGESDIESFVSSGDIDGLAVFCEETELKSINCHPVPDVYSSLLAVYLLKNELDHAKLLWKRIPGDVKVSHPEIGKLWEIGTKLWIHSFSDVYSLIKDTTWPTHIVPILAMLNEKIRSRVLQLIGCAYSNISLNQFCVLLGLESQQALEVAAQQRWTFDEKVSVIYPKKTKSSTKEIEEPQARLAELVDIVSFLEN
ncbi:PREDICTED: COP9 signalosome complex subunit 8-like [Amphimedon queenslandica]|uniref:CSN8/PSMD8/EIF3K domain-containing protein n=1 Tax=Amphimedon queenslandica TaxID=400682 RepID=A0A1X7UK80_AMPQE|nr:PREDICTED: COP9 signalosome complex subunit 8-like [Amphimedon queenslandica]|eukprot:XP_003387711.1 PREDICTED: COP9 signalosome complex subunit 8-like [Amphimedon queenslandica]